MYQTIIEKQLQRAKTIAARIKPISDTIINTKVYRARRIVDLDGAVIYEYLTEIVASHEVVFRPLYYRDARDFGADTIYYEGSHRVEPLLPQTGIKVNDFYFINGKYYRITHIQDFGIATHFIVLEQEYGIAEKGDERLFLHHTKSVGAGNYTFGISPFAAVQNLAQTPYVFFNPVSDGEGYIDNLTTTGFSVIDRGIGQPVSLDIVIFENISNGGDIFFARDLTSGQHSFSILFNTTFSNAPIIILSAKADSDYYIKNVSNAGFEAVKRLGTQDKFDLLVIRHPQETGKSDSIVVKNLGPGRYNFGTDIPELTSGYEPIVLTQKTNDSSFFINVTSNYIDIFDRGIGQTTQVDVIFFKK